MIVVDFEGNEIFKYICQICGKPNNYWELNCEDCEDPDGGDGPDD